MTVLAPSFIGSYSGDLIYNITEFYFENYMQKYVDSIEFVFDSIYDQKQTGFRSSFYLQNLVNARRPTGEIQLTLTADSPHWLVQRLSQLAKACMGSGMEIIFIDTIATRKRYYCKWENAGDFAETSAVLAGGNINFRFYQIGQSNAYQDTYGTVSTNWQDNYGATGTTYQNQGI